MIEKKLSNDLFQKYLKLREKFENHENFHVGLFF